jgi:surface antigen
MKRKLLSATLVLALAALLVSGCATTEQGALGGGLVGAGVGAIIGAALGDPGLGAAIGGVVGMAAGAAAGAENQRRFVEANQAKLALLPGDWKNTPGELAANQGRLCYVTTGGDYIVWREDEQCWRPDD